MIRKILISIINALAYHCKITEKLCKFYRIESRPQKSSQNYCSKYPWVIFLRENKTIFTDILSIQHCCGCSCWTDIDGFIRVLLPACLPDKSRNEVDKNSSEQMKKYKHKKEPESFKTIWKNIDINKNWWNGRQDP